MSPKIHNTDAPKFVVTTSRATKDLFDEFVERHQPERDMLPLTKASAVYTAIAITDAFDTEGGEYPTIGDVASLENESVVELAEKRGVADDNVKPVDIALAAYANWVRSFEWGAEKSTLSDDAFVFLHDGLRTFKDAGESAWDGE